MRASISGPIRHGGFQTFVTLHELYCPRCGLQDLTCTDYQYLCSLQDGEAGEEKTAGEAAEEATKEEQVRLL